MVQTLATNGNNDLFVNASSGFTMLSWQSAIAAACGTACKAQLGEMVLKTGLGLPNFSLVWNGTPDYQLWQSYLQNTILSVEGVQDVQSIRLSAAQHKLLYQAEITTIYGPTTIRGSV